MIKENGYIEEEPCSICGRVFSSPAIAREGNGSLICWDCSNERETQQIKYNDMLTHDEISSLITAAEEYADKLGVYEDDDIHGAIIKLKLARESNA